mgnify:CR=1 FL=1
MEVIAESIPHFLAKINALTFKSVYIFLADGYTLTLSDFDKLVKPVKISFIRNRNFRVCNRTVNNNLDK